MPTTAKISRALSVGEEMLSLHLRAHLIPFEREWRFSEKTRHRFDFALLAVKLAIEVDGGTWSNGRHSRHAGFEADARKGNLAIALGWRVLHFTPEMVASGEAIDSILALLAPT